MVRRHDEPWRPSTLRVFRITSTMSRRRSPSSSPQESKPRRVFDARYRIDGYDFRYRFEQKGWAEAFLRGLQDNFAQGWLFDPMARRFVDRTPIGWWKRR